ncbi:MAG: hypothetical protein GTO45_11985, partial [Candidatus Aminicenantes bacterium]|nr:hypothetical protein [Candidatus Aminicenantes bacterium]NIN18815.1 hypothetical protein [Candidatus Aminicenantes bacterium]NIN42737.1 hypothetical protein [Candidatus Aminicenantes bacterium]NIN85468.1 hypothetical protein [Candidatus Aminicenantes bacterium]NIO81708.1 hypothetical protein [Candidatus Aminicenantes bacterium]
MKKKKSTHKKRAKDRKKSAVVVRGSDRVVFDKLDKIFAKLLILMGAFQAISLKLAHVRVFQHFFEVRYFDRFAGVGVMLIIIGLIVLLRKWVTRNVMRLLSVLLTVALIIQVYVIFDLHYHLSLINKIEIERGENSITIMAITITII